MMLLSCRVTSTGAVYAMDCVCSVASHMPKMRDVFLTDQFMQVLARFSRRCVGLLGHDII